MRVGRGIRIGGAATRQWVIPTAKELHGQQEDRRPPVPHPRQWRVRHRDHRQGRAPRRATRASCARHDEVDEEYGDIDEDGHTFLFTLNDDYVVDANVGGNIARWINHSCKPNCEAVIEENDKGKRHKDKVFIEAIRAIKPGEELTYNYGITLDERAHRQAEEVVGVQMRRQELHRDDAAAQALSARFGDRLRASAMQLPHRRPLRKASASTRARCRAGDGFHD